MRTTLRAAAALAVPLLALAACSGSGGSETACKAAMTRDYATATAHHDTAFATEPAACKGLPAATLKRITGEVLTSAMAGTLASAAPAPAVTEPAAAPDVTAADIARQLGATGIEDLTAPAGTSFAVTEATGTWRGLTIDVAVFANTAERAKWEKIERESFKVTDNGPGSPPYAVADITRR